MNLHASREAQHSLQSLVDAGVLTAGEMATASALADDTALSDCVSRAETIHLHIKVDDTEALPVTALLGAGAHLDHGRPGFVKYCFPGGLNAIFSHIHVAADDLRETPANRRPRPFLDHIGIDLREESDVSRRAFDGLPAIAAQRGWAHATQGGNGKAVMCCHSEVAQKHWLFPEAVAGRAQVPLEFAYGPLRLNPESYGCDLRPSDPRKVQASASSACCAAKVQPGALTVP